MSLCIEAERRSAMCPMRVGAHLRSYRRTRDADLIAACLSGEPAAWEALIRRYEGLIWACIHRTGLSPADAEDVFQNVCLLLLEHLDSLRDANRLAGWLTSLTRREALRIRRKRLRTRLFERTEWDWETQQAGTASQDAFALEAAVVALAEKNTVQQALALLPERNRALLRLLYVEEPPLTYEQIASRLDMPLGSIGPSRARSLRRLQGILKELGF